MNVILHSKVSTIVNTDITRESALESSTYSFFSILESLTISFHPTIKNMLPGTFISITNARLPKSRKSGKIN